VCVYNFYFFKLLYRSYWFVYNTRLCRHPAHPKVGNLNKQEDCMTAVRFSALLYMVHQAELCGSLDPGEQTSEVRDKPFHQMWFPERSTSNHSAGNMEGIFLISIQYSSSILKSYIILQSSIEKVLFELKFKVLTKWWGRMLTTNLKLCSCILHLWAFWLYITVFFTLGR